MVDIGPNGVYMQQIHLDLDFYFKLVTCCHNDFLIAQVVLVNVIFLFCCQSGLAASVCL